MRRLGSLAAVLVLAAVSASAALGVSPPIRFRPISGPVGVAGTQTTLKVVVSSHQAGAKPVTVTLGYTGPLHCGRPGGATVVLPAAVGIGPATAVKVNGKRGLAVKHGHSLTVSSTLAPTSCNSITVGSITLQVGGLTNPAKSGTYALHVASGAATYAGTFSVG